MKKLFAEPVVNRILLSWMTILAFSGLQMLQGQRGFEIGGWLGASHYFGDLNTRFDVMHPGLGAGAIARYNFNRRVCAKVSANYGFLRADDANSSNAFERRRNLNFRTHLGDLSGQIEFNFFPYIHGSREYFYTPYLFAGFSIFTYSPYAIYNDEKTPPPAYFGYGGTISRGRVSIIPKGHQFWWWVKVRSDTRMELKCGAQYTQVIYRLSR